MDRLLTWQNPSKSHGCMLALQLHLLGCSILNTMQLGQSSAHNP